MNAPAFEDNQLPQGGVAHVVGSTGPEPGGARSPTSSRTRLEDSPTARRPSSRNRTCVGPGPSSSGRSTRWRTAF